MLKATIIFKGYYADEAPFTCEPDIFEVEAFAETAAELYSFIQDNIKEPQYLGYIPSCGPSLIVDWTIVKWELFDNSLWNFEEWRYK